jgi:hypothetical protein
MLVGRCSSQLSSHKLQAKSKKSQAPSEADLSRHAVEGSAVFLKAYNHPLLRASRAASIRFAAPNLLIASDK